MAVAPTTTEKRECAERELKMRELVYGRRVYAGKMAKGAADREIAFMRAIAADYREQEDREATTTTTGEKNR